ncbi:PREDICTED: uncharacterized protein LOC108557769 [Nicrophorus vespilloides]|uniref:Uncharacterized protein LOC108557769 n=1 Tax=Nicrophorus vespilloides TaxID=110193 RepID=A0ABM1M5R2_NICVS|nr:PREDICTED: uncharacterized protein LOC108557769 [Nicrophorus vespilloides]
MELTLFLTIAVVFTSVQGDHCDSLGTLFYDELGCTPNLGNDGCPTSYDCPDITVPDGFCKYGGKLYQNGQYVNGTKICQPGYCSSSKIGLMFVDCFQRHEEGCYYAYTFDKCCSSKQICEPFDDIGTCEIGDKIYKYGQRFSVPGHCLNCICQENFSGELVEPFCERTKCGIEITDDPISDKSAPVYYNEAVRCCPIELIKPSYVTNLTTIPSVNTSEEKCEFGNNAYNLGDILFVQYENPLFNNEEAAICTCILPPLLTCTQV